MGVSFTTWTFPASALERSWVWGRMLGSAQLLSARRTSWVVTALRFQLSLRSSMFFTFTTLKVGRKIVHGGIHTWDLQTQTDLTNKNRLYSTRYTININNTIIVSPCYFDTPSSESISTANNPLCAQSLASVAVLPQTQGHFCSTELHVAGPSRDASLPLTGGRRGRFTSLARMARAKYTPLVF